MNSFLKDMMILDNIDSLSPELQKASLLYYIRCYGDISVILLDTEENKVIWYNKKLYSITKKALVYVNNQHLMSFRDTKLLCPQQMSGDFAERILTSLNDMSLLDETITSEIIPCEIGIFNTLMNHKLKTTFSNSMKAESLCLFIGKMIYKYMVSNNRSISDIARDFEEYLTKYYEKIVYVLC